MLVLKLAILTLYDCCAEFIVEMLVDKLLRMLSVFALAAVSVLLSAAVKADV